MTISPRAEVPVVHQMSKYGSCLDSFHISSLRARGVCALTSEEKQARFVIGSCSLGTDKNQIQVISFDESDNQIKIDGSHSHPYAILDLAGHPTERNIFAGVCAARKSDSTGNLLSLYHLRREAGSQESLVSEEMLWSTQPVKGISMLSGGDVCVARSDMISVHRMKGEFGSSEVARIPTTDCSAIAADPNRESTIGFVSDRSISLWDTRTKEASVVCKTSQLFPIQCLDMNPSLEYMIVTGGSEGQMMFWDIRQPSECVESVIAHNHHVRSVKYHPTHDQLVLSSGTDCSVKLWRYQSVSSTPPKPLPLTVVGMSQTPPRVPDGLIQSVNRHEDSVYRCCWARDGWTYASVSTDGTLMINSTPQSEKYRIML